MSVNPKATAQPFYSLTNKITFSTTLIIKDYKINNIHCWQQYRERTLSYISSGRETCLQLQSNANLSTHIQGL